MTLANKFLIGILVVLASSWLISQASTHQLPAVEGYINGEYMTCFEIDAGSWMCGKSE